VTRRARPVAVLAGLLALAGLVAAGCDATARPPTLAGPACLVATAAPHSPGAGALPDLSLPCFTGNAPVRLAALGRPTVINLWASWCTPCRTEMPAIQRYATGAAGKVTVIGVDTGDRRSGAESVIQDLGITYPNLVDDRQQLLHGLGRSSLPVTLFVDAAGSIRHVYAGDPLTETALAQLVTAYLGAR
jgi:thiol-disulfide isomerase/thioredoxin